MARRCPIEAARGQRGGCGGAGAPRAAARAGMSFRCIVGTAVAALLLCGVGFGAPAAGGAGGERPRDTGAGSDDAAGLEEELRIGAAELAAVPAESRAVLAKVLGRLEGMRGELEELKAGKARSDARIARLEESLEGESSAYRHRKQDTSDASGATALPPTCYGTDDIAMVALNASVALSQSHEQLRELLLSDASTRQQLVERLGTKANTSAVDAQLLRLADRLQVGQRGKQKLLLRREGRQEGDLWPAAHGSSPCGCAAEAPSRPHYTSSRP